MICKIAYIFLFIICSNVSLLWGQTFVFRGTVLDEQTHKALDYATVQLFVDKQIVYGGIVSIRPRACFFPLFSFLPLWLHYNLNPLCVQY